MRTLTVAVILLGSTATAAPRAKPTLEHGDVTIAGDLDATPVTKVVKRSSAKLLGCYKKALVLKPALYGTATATFTIAADGKVTTADTAGLTVSAGACIAATIMKLRFAKPGDGQPVKVTYPLTFEPSAIASLPRTGVLHGTGTGQINGGVPFGLTDHGPGGGGTGGPLGMGRLGGLSGGRGNGSGYGVGGSRGRGGVSPGQSSTQGNLDKAIIRRFITRNLGKLASCYEKELLTTPTLRGTVTASFTIGSDGLVVASTASGLANPNVQTCVAAVIKAIEFPKPKGGPVTVKYPLMFEPADPTPAAKP